MAAKENMISGRHYQTGVAVNIILSGEKISKVVKDSAVSSDNLVEAPGLADPSGDGSDLIIAPGLADLQVNGYGGMDFNTAPLLPETVREITERLWRDGVTTYFPTLITNSDKNLTESLEAIAEACSRYREVAETVGGVHMEGPFISPEEGARGAHPAAYVRPPDWELFCRWQEASGGMIRIMTLSPEWPGAALFIRRLTGSGVIAAIGHTAASPEQIREAVEAGATLSTHLGNASHQMMHRHRNYLWEQLAADRLFATIISDGYHLPDAVMKVFLRMKPGRIALISDATGLTGMPPGDYKTHIGGEVTLTADGKLHMRGMPDVLAGSGKSLLHCLYTLVKKGLATRGDAFDMAGRIPMALAAAGRARPGISTASGMADAGKTGTGVVQSNDGMLLAGAVADLIVVREGADGMSVVKTLKRGRVVYSE